MNFIRIIILNWNGYVDTEELIESIFKITDINYRITVVDNGSSGDDVEKLKSKYGLKIDILSLNDNYGFAGGINLGIFHLLNDNSDFILLVNNDTIVKPNLLKELVPKFQLDSKIGVIAPQINYYSERNLIWSSEGKIAKIRASGFAKTNQNDYGIKKQDQYVDFVSGCCMLIKKEIFKDVGFFDESYFLYLEDTDFCYRVRKSGYKILFTSDTIIYHKVSNSTSHNLSELPLYYVTRNRLYFSKKNLSKIYYLSLFYLITSMIFKSFLWLLTGKVKNIHAVKLAFSDFFKQKMGKTDHKIFKMN